MTNSPIVTLTTDWGDEGLFVGMVKGRLCTLIPDVRIVDITHHLAPFDLRDATFVVEHACTAFPEGTVHIIDVSSYQTPDSPFIVVRCWGQYYICTDNGLPAQVFGDEAEEVCTIDVYQTGEFYNFAAYDLFVVVAAMLHRGAALSTIGEPHPQLQRRMQTHYIEQDGSTLIYIRHVDPYGNAYLGMTYDEFERLRAGRRFELTVREYRLQEVVRSYYDKPSLPGSPQKLRLTVSATGLLELALCESSFRQLIGLQAGDLVQLRFM